MPALTPNLWFDTEALEAAEFYVSVFPNSSVGRVSRYSEAGPRETGTVMAVSFTLDGTDFTAINGGPQFKFSEAISFHIGCADQDEVDYYWERLGEGGQEGRCGWLKDRFGLSWQVVPDELPAILGDPDAGRRERAMEAMLKMSRLDVAALRAAADDVVAT